MMVLCNATSMPVDYDTRRCSSNNSGCAACSAMGCSHPHMQMVCCNTMVWTDETEEGGRLKVLVIRSYPVACTMVVVTGASNTVRAADGDSRREALHGAQMVREAVAGDAAHADVQEPPGR